MKGDEDTELEEVQNHLRHSGTPTVSFKFNTPEELSAELFKWEIATALACSQLGVNPFTEPDVREGREKTAELLEALATKHELPRRTVRVREAGIELYAEGTTRQHISTLSLSEALRTFFELRNPDGYFAILTFLEQNVAVGATLTRLREQLAAKLRIPV
jgi:transaldolase/glucose-6-phosphate isomerase